MKILGTFRYLSMVAILGLVIVSCSSSNDNSPFNNQLNGYGTYNNGNSEVITDFNTLEQRIDERFDVDLGLLQSNNRIACKYYCNEETRFPKLGCIREFTNDNGQMAYRTYQAKFRIFQNVLDIDGNKGSEISGASGFVTKASLKANLFSRPEANIQVSPVQGFLYGIGQINIYPINTVVGRIGISPDIPAAANLLENKTGSAPEYSDTWCTIQN